MINTGHINGKFSKSVLKTTRQICRVNSTFLYVIMCLFTKNISLFCCYSFYLRVTRQVKNNPLPYSLYAVNYRDNTIKLSFSLYLYLTLSKTTSNARVKSTSCNRRKDKWLHYIKLVLKEIQQQQTNKIYKMEKKNLKMSEDIRLSLFSDSN